MKKFFAIMFSLFALSAAAQSEQPVETQSIEVFDSETLELKSKRHKSFKTMQISAAGAVVSTYMFLFAWVGDIPEAVGVLGIGTGIVSSAVFLVSTVKTIVYSIKIIKAKRKRGGLVY